MDVALYARVSTDEQSQALEQQQARLDAHAATLAASVTSHWYVDIASGTRDDRPELARLMADATAGRFAVVLVTRLDRLSRNSSHGAQLLRFFQQETTPTLIALDDSLNLGEPGGRFMARMLISWAEAESDRLSERTRHGHAHRRQQLKPFGSKAPFGYRFTADGSNLELDPETGPIAADLVRFFLRNPVTGQAITYSKEQHGIPWSTDYTFRRWICNPSLAGARCYGQDYRVIDPVTGQKKRIARPPGEYAQIIPDCHPAIMTREEHARILAVYHARSKRGTAPLQAGRVRLLTGMVACGHCGRNMFYHASNTPAQNFYMRCHARQCDQRFKNSIKVATLMERIQVTILHNSSEVVQLEAINRRPADESPEVKKLREQIQRLEHEDDPDLDGVLVSKKQRLATLLERAGVVDLGAESRRLHDPATWSEWAENPEPLRELLLAAGLRVTVADRRVVKVSLSGGR